MNGNYTNLIPTLYTSKNGGIEEGFDTKALEMALDRWVNEGGYYSKNVERGSFSAKQGGFVSSGRS